MDKVPIFIISVIVLAGVIFWGVQSGFFTKNQVVPTPLPSGAVLFFAQDCPHCKIVEDYITQNKIDEKVKYTKLEVPFNGRTSPQFEANASLAINLAKSCKLDASNGVGIPFLYDGSKCYLGQDDVINFFKNAANIK